MNPFSFLTAGKIVAGRHSLENISEHLKLFDKIKSVLIVAQSAVERLGYLTDLIKQLEQNGISCQWTTEVRPEPTADQIEDIYRKIRHDTFDLIIGIGGGSVLDTTKVLSVLMTNGTKVREILGIDQVRKPGIPTVLVPTTSGTGSEVTPNAIVTLPEEELKIGIISRFLMPELVIIDPMTTLELPKQITASTGMDAFTHAIESYISNKANPISDMFALESIRKIAGSILTAYHVGKDVVAREDMMIGSMYGGMALSSAGTAAVHAMAYPIGAKFYISHGNANSMLLPHVMEFNLEASVDRLARVGVAMGLNINCDQPYKIAENVLITITDWTKQLNISQDLKAYGVTEEDVPGLALAASKVTRLMDNNPRKMEIQDIEAIYRKLFPVS